VGSWIIGTEIGFDLDNASGQPLTSLPAHQDFPQQVRPHQPRIAVVEIRRKNPKRSWLHLFRRRAHSSIIAAITGQRKYGLYRDLESYFVLYVT